MRRTDTKHTCPSCGEAADLCLAVFYENKDVPNKSCDWRLDCGCGLGVEGSLALAEKTVAMLLYFAPISVLWGLFLSYGWDSQSAGLGFVVWLVHIVPGVLLGDRLCSKYTAGRAGKQIDAHGR